MSRTLNAAREQYRIKIAERREMLAHRELKEVWYLFGTNFKMHVAQFFQESLNIGYRKVEWKIGNIGISETYCKYQLHQTPNPRGKQLQRWGEIWCLHYSHYYLREIISHLTCRLTHTMSPTFWNSRMLLNLKFFVDLVVQKGPILVFSWHTNNSFIRLGNVPKSKLLWQ